MRKLLLLASAAFAGAFVASADPYAAYYFPSGIQAGTTTRVVVGGQGIGSILGGWISGTGVRIVKITPVPGLPRAVGFGQSDFISDWLYECVAGTHVHKDLPPSGTCADTDWSRCSWWETIDERDALELAILARDRFVPKNDLQASPALAQLLILDMEADESAEPGRRDIVLYDYAGTSVPHVFYVTKAPRVVEPFYVIPPQKKDGEVFPLPPEPVDLPVVFDGQIWPGEVDSHRLRLKKGTRLTCVLTGREMLPYLGDAVPGFFNPVLRLADPKGRELAFEDDFFYLPDPILSYVIPEDGVYTLEVHDNLYRGRSDFVYMVECFADKPNGPSYVPQERAFACFPQPLTHRAPSTRQAGADVRTGVIDCPGRIVRHALRIEEPKTLVFNLFARRCGSPLDGVVRLYGPVGAKTPLSAAPLLAEWDDDDKFLVGSVPQALCDPRGSWHFRELGDYVVTVSDRSGEGGDLYDYTLAMAEPHPSFEVYSEKSSLHLNSEGVAKFRARVVRRNGFKGSVRFLDDADYVFEGEFTPDVERAEFTVTARNPKKGMTLATFKARGQTAPGKERRVTVTPADSVEQAFAYTHLLPARAFYVYSEE